eukprot:TRINITY_DN6145_c0_g1_i2.p1 TRINITY_DN6145_c0_g1~~TRINITY_DN6145_c0_g1_i2.p1  ORF type:complete len:1001 (-),score=168.14 TRINITY_DN6145_c0_g1_i2:121-3027(-)
MVQLSFLHLVLALFAFVPTLQGQKLCHMMYLNADNDLEAPIVRDLEEITGNSAFMAREGYKLYVLLDRYKGDKYYHEVLKNSYTASGKLRTEESTGTNLYTWDQTSKKLMIKTSTSFTGSEKNLDDKATLKAFLDEVLPLCKASGTDTYFLQGGSHGASFVGFGGDEAKSRRLASTVMENEDFAAVVKQSLTANGIAKLDMLGFDACLMASYSSMRAYAGVTKYLLASEAVEPGHGWDYSKWTASYTSIVDLGKQVIDTFVSSYHGWDEHEVPKTLALLDLTKFANFETKLDAFWVKLTEGLKAGDGSISKALGRSISSAVRFLGSGDMADSKGKQSKSSTDIGDFFRLFKNNCPSGGSTASTSTGQALDAAITAYNALIVHFKYGEGSPTKTTGVQFYLPEYKIAFDDMVYARDLTMCHTGGNKWCEYEFFEYISVAYKNFMNAYYTESLVSGTVANPVCIKGTGVMMKTGTAIAPVGITTTTTTATTTTTTKAGTTTTTAVATTATTTTFAKGSNGCYTYPAGTVGIDYRMDPCSKHRTSKTHKGAEGGMSVQTLVHERVVQAEAGVIVVIKVGDRLVDVCTHDAEVEWDGDVATAVMDGYVYSIDKQVVRIVQAGGPDKMEVAGFYFDKGTEPIISKANLTNRASSKMGFLTFTAWKGQIKSAVSLFVQGKDGFSAVEATAGGKFVPLLEDDTAPWERFEAAVPWDAKMKTRITGVDLKTAASSGIIDTSWGTAWPYFDLDTDDSLKTKCYAQTVEWKLQNFDICTDGLTTLTTTKAATATTKAATIPAGMVVLRQMIGGTMKFAVSDKAGFIKDLKAEAGIQKGLALALNVPADYITIVLEARRRLNDPATRRLSAGTVSCTYGVTVPKSSKVTSMATVQAKLKAASANKATFESQILDSIKKEAGASKYTVTLTTFNPPDEPVDMYGHPTDGGGVSSTSTSPSIRSAPLMAAIGLISVLLALP